MSVLRTSNWQDIPRLRELWKLAFGDEGAYIDHFFEQYYTPERVLVLEENGAVQAMTAWFKTTLKQPDCTEWKGAYLYAVATHPDCRGRGFAGQLLAYAGEYLRWEQGVDCLTTVPARPDLHPFFGKNGFQECFVLAERPLEGEQLPLSGPETILRPVAPQEYGALREQLLAELPHVSYGPAALDYQAGCCRMSGGGLYRGDTAAGPVCLCAEGAGDGLMVLKEFLGSPAAVRLAQGDLPRAVPARRWLVREPSAPGRGEEREFAMVKWLTAEVPPEWKGMRRAYLGLAFD